MTSGRRGARFDPKLADEIDHVYWTSNGSVVVRRGTEDDDASSIRAGPRWPARGGSLLDGLSARARRRPEFGFISAVTLWSFRLAKAARNRGGHGSIPAPVARPRISDHKPALRATRDFAPSPSRWPHSKETCARVGNDRRTKWDTSEHHCSPSLWSK